VRHRGGRRRQGDRRIAFPAQGDVERSFALAVVLVDQPFGGGDVESRQDRFDDGGVALVHRRVERRLAAVVGLSS